MCEFGCSNDGEDDIVDDQIKIWWFKEEDGVIVNDWKVRSSKMGN